MTTAERLAAHGIPDYMVRGYAQAEAMYAGMNVVSPSIGRGLTADLLDIIERLASDPPAPEVPEALRHLPYTPSLSPSADDGPCWYVDPADLPDGWRRRHGPDEPWSVGPRVQRRRAICEAQPIPAPEVVRVPWHEAMRQPGHLEGMRRPDADGGGRYSVPVTHDRALFLRGGAHQPIADDGTVPVVPEVET